MTTLLDALAAAATTPPAGGPAFTGAEPDREGSFQRYQHTVAVQAGRAERALTVALDALGEVVAAVPELHLGTDVGRLSEMLVVAAKFGVLAAKLRHLPLQVGQLEPQVGHEILKLRVTQFLCDLVSLFCRREEVVLNAQTRASCALELLRMAGDSNRDDCKQLHDIAIGMFLQDAGLTIDSDGEVCIVT